MKRIWVAPASNTIAKKHLNSTVENSIDRDHLNLGESDLNIRLSKYFKAWGFEEKHKTKYQKLEEGDLITFYSNKKLIYTAEIIKKISSRKLSDAIWMHSNNDQNWPLIVLLSNVKRIDVPIEDVNIALGYKDNFVFQSNSLFDEEKAQILSSLVEAIFDEAIANAREEEFTLKYSKIEVINNGSTPQRGQRKFDIERTMKTKIKKNFVETYKSQEKIGLHAEKVVIEYLKDNYEFDNLIWMREQNNTSPFDIVLENKTFRTMIEVKGTKSDSIKTDFYMSASEYEFAVHCYETGIPYKLIRVIDVALNPKVVELDFADLMNGDYITPDTFKVSMSQYDKK